MKLTMSSAGWVVATALGGVLLASGFQGSQDKVGVVDPNKAIQDSSLGKKNEESVKAAFNARSGVLEFMQTHRVLTMEQARKIRDLSLKTGPLSETEKQDLQKTKDDVIQAAKAFDALNQKASPTDDDRRQLQEYNQRAQSTAQLVSEWNQTFLDDLNSLKGQVSQDSLKRFDQAVKDVAKKDGYTVVYSSGAVVYAANDLTEAVTKALDAGK